MNSIMMPILQKDPQLASCYMNVYEHASRRRRTLLSDAFEYQLSIEIPSI